MSLLFDSDVEYVNVGTMGWNMAAAAWSAYGWFVPINDAGNCGLFGKAHVGSPFTPRVRITWRTSSGVCEFEITGTVTLKYQITAHPWSIGVINFFAFTFNPSGSANDLVRIYKGLLNTPPTLQTLNVTTDGSGYHDTSAEIMLLGNNGLGSEEDLNGELLSISFVNENMTLAQICAAWTRDIPLPRRGYWELGQNGTSTQLDWSGNGNHGIVTGASIGKNNLLSNFNKRTNFTRPLKRFIA